MPRTAVFGACLALLGAGCTGHRTVIAHDPDRPPKARPAPDAADYILFRTGDRGDEEMLDRRPLARREPVGFARDDAGLVAVAGAHRRPLRDGTYRWAVARPGADAADARLAAAGRVYMNLLEPVQTAVGAIVTVPMLLVMGLFGWIPGGRG